MIRVINLVLTICIAGAAYLLVRTIQEPIKFNAKFNDRDVVVKEKLLYIKDLQMAYKDVYGTFTNSFDTLIQFVENDTLQLIRIIGDPDELDAEGNPVPVTFDTVKVAAIDSLLNSKFPLAELQNVPNVQDEVFQMDAGTLRKSRIIVPVFEVFATFPQILKGLNKNYIDPSKLRAVGSMAEPKYNGNWD